MVPHDPRPPHVIDVGQLDAALAADADARRRGEELHKEAAHDHKTACDKGRWAKGRYGVRGPVPSANGQHTIWGHTSTSHRGQVKCCDSTLPPSLYSRMDTYREVTFARCVPGNQINAPAIYPNALPPSYRAWGALFTIANAYGAKNSGVPCTEKAKAVWTW